MERMLVHFLYKETIHTGPLIPDIIPYTDQITFLIGPLTSTKTGLIPYTEQNAIQAVTPVTCFHA